MTKEVHRNMLLQKLADTVMYNITFVEDPAGELKVRREKTYEFWGVYAHRQAALTGAVVPGQDILEAASIISPNCPPTVPAVPSGPERQDLHEEDGDNRAHRPR